MELHRELPFGLRLDIGKSHGSRDLYVVTQPYGARGVMVGFNGENGHFLSITEDGREELYDGHVISLDIDVDLEVMR